jgi:hypothetical protein
MTRHLSQTLQHCAVLVLLLFCSPSQAASNFVSNPYLPYPPACVQETGGSTPGRVPANAVKFHDGTVSLFDAKSGGRMEVRLAAYRSPCAEPDRSLIWLDFQVPAPLAAGSFKLELPVVSAEPEQHRRFLMNLVTSPNGWGAWGQVERERTYLVSEWAYPEFYLNASDERRWVFLLDAGPSDSATGPEQLSATQYNAAFRLWLRYPPEHNVVSFEVPATAALLPQPAPPLPLSGRHSGAWVVQGAEDQGFQLSILEQVGRRTDFAEGRPELPLLLFFSQYTFDAQSRPVWLVGSAEFPAGATAVTFEIFSVRNGQFRGSVPAQRERVGLVTLTSRSCNDVLFAYDYNSIALGAGTRRLQRIFSLETAGYDCRDHEARVAGNR